MEKKLHKTFAVVKELPAALADKRPNGEDGFWCYLTREIVDSSGDIVRVGGVSFDQYHNPPETHLKILAQHIRALPNGEAPIIGRVEDVVKTVVPYKAEMVKALAVFVAWARDGSGVVMPLAKHYKDLYEGGFIDQMSVGIMVDQYAEIEETGGIDITKSSIFEASLVTIPANAAATVIKAIKDKLGDLIEEPEEKFVTEKDGSQWIKKEDHEAIVLAGYEEAYQVLLSERKKNSEVEPYALQELVGKAVSEQLSPIVASLNQMIERFDLLESAIVVLSESAVSQEKAHHPDDSSTQGLEAFNKMLDDTLRFLSK